MSSKFKPGDRVRVLVNPWFSACNRVGEPATIREFLDEHRKPYLAVEEDIARIKSRPEQRVSWPLVEEEVEYAQP